MTSGFDTAKCGINSTGPATVDDAVRTSTALAFDTNPIVRNISRLSATGLEEFLGQYCHFPRNIISVLVSACYTMGYHRWYDVVNELRENIHEELGLGYETISENMPPHYSMLRRAIHDSLSIDIDKAEMGDPTRTFLQSVNAEMKQAPARAVGAVYALEATAVPELKIVYFITQHLFELREIPLPIRLKQFFEFHIDKIELEHQERLLATFGRYITEPSQEAEFGEGFQFVVDAMDTWWADLLVAITK